MNLFKDLSQNKNYLEFGYKTQDSLFNAAASDPPIFDSTANTLEKKIASKGELLDFSKGKKPKEKAEAASPNKIIRLNSASVSELLTLPGLGKRTVENVLEYRKKNGRFKKINDLLKVKGIGKTKFEKIKKLVTID
ncbi:MAG: helix-hairpin-helix domain-containing protein [Bacteroidetes bacterium]|nr:helix-hairpin-helix domain-containing protein [Bacteroidota bacterium]